MKTQKTKIEFEYKGKPIVLEYTADSIRKMEERGFDISLAEKRLLTIMGTLFCGAFIANHDDIEEEERRAIYNELSASAEDDDIKIDDIVVQMFQEALNEMSSHRGNLKWRIAR